MQLNIGPTQQSNEANSVYQRYTDDANKKRGESNSKDDDENWLNFVLFLIIPSAWGYFTKDFATPGVEWQQGLFMFGMLLSLVVSYLALPVLRFIWGLVLLFAVGSLVLALGYEGVKYLFN